MANSFSRNLSVCLSFYFNYFNDIFLYLFLFSNFFLFFFDMKFTRSSKQYTQNVILYSLFKIKLFVKFCSSYCTQRFLFAGRWVNRYFPSGYATLRNGSCRVAVGNYINTPPSIRTIHTKSEWRKKPQSSRILCLPL